jgi:hypothetical protein
MMSSESVPRRAQRLRLTWQAYVNLAAPLTIVILAIGGLRLVLMVAEAAGSPGAIGIDYNTAMDAARRWLGGSSPYLARQLAGPYTLLGANLSDSGEMLYPPVVLPFYAVASAVPAILWWAIPIVASLGALWIVRPARWSWPILALCLTVGPSLETLIAGNPVMWIIATSLWAPSLGWPGPLALLKPSVAPLALLGIRHREWWIAAGVLAVGCLAFGSLWVDWYRSVVNMRTPGMGGILYSVPAIAAAAARPGTRRGALWGNGAGHETAPT